MAFALEDMKTSNSKLVCAVLKAKLEKAKHTDDLSTKRICIFYLPSYIYTALSCSTALSAKSLLGRKNNGS